MTSHEEQDGDGILRFPSRRGEATHFKSWADYVRVLHDPDESPLLEILTERGRRPRTGTKAPAVQRKSRQIPWVTFVLGSGCLTAADVSPNDVPLVRDGVPDMRAQLAADLDDVVDEFPNLRLDNLAARFLELLTVERTGVSDVKEALATVVVRDDVQPQEQSARVALAAALATQLYATALGTRPLLQAADRELAVLDLASSNGVVARAEIITPLKHTLDLLSATDGAATPHAQQALSALARTVAGSVSKGRIRRFHVELLTAFAWYFFTAGTRVYPGWTELMLLRTFDDSAWFEDEVVTASSAGSQLRPRIRKLHGQGDWVSKRMVDVTNRSWASRLSQPQNGSERDAFYDLVARFLRQQATAVLPVAKEKPAPVCFVTSFDLELEMALWETGQPFVVILPVFALDEDWKHSASLHWVWTQVTPTPPAATSAEPRRSSVGADTAPEGLTLPSALWRPGGWELVGPDLRSKLPNRGCDIPIVVRLAGSPLMELPGPGNLTPRPTSRTSELHHALLLDEYTAFQQAYQDIDEGSASSGALPTFLSEDTGPTRTWVLLGTQLGDPAVRLRMTAHHLKRRIKANQKSDKPKRTEAQQQAMESEEALPDANSNRSTSGIVINAMSHISDRELFLWQDFDVVDGSHTDLVPQLQELLSDVERELAAVEPRPSGEERQGGGSDS